MAVFTAMAAHAKTQENLSVLLNDALYSLNRYEELVIGVNCGSWKTDEELRRLCAQGIRVVSKGVDSAKIALMRAMKARSPSLVDLLEIYSELEETALHLEELGDNVSNYQEGEEGREEGHAFTQASAKTLVLGSKLYVQLRDRLLLEEQRCQEK